jgi:5-hydroxyisourate hydrolase
VSGITTHVLDTSRGKPAAGVRLRLERVVRNGQRSPILAEATTDENGRVRESLPWPKEKGIYRLTFDAGAYYRAQGIASFFPEVVVTFEVTDSAQDYHVPLLLSPFGYSTYRGS